MRIALFGGSFNPPHVAHQLACLYVLSTQPVDEVWLIPCFQHRYGKQLAAFEDRFDMCVALATPFGSAVRVSRVEQELGGISRTLLTVRRLRALYPTAQLSIVVGEDLSGDLHGWYGWGELSQLVEVIVLGRQGYGDATSGPRVRLPAVSSSEVRRGLGAGEDVSDRVPTAVRELIAQRGLYVGDLGTPRDIE